MNRKSKTKRVILVVVMLVCLIALIGGTYSRYTSTGSANVTAKIAKWKVKLGTQDISTESKTINVDFNYDTNEYVKTGKIAPGSSGYFEVELDPTGSEVAIDYLFTIDKTNIANSLITGSTSKIEVTGATYSIVGSEVSGTADVVNGNTVTFTEPLADVLAGRKATVRVLINWDNASDANNNSDTAEGLASYAAGQNGKTVTIPVSVTARQHID